MLKRMFGIIARPFYAPDGGAGDPPAPPTPPTPPEKTFTQAEIDAALEAERNRGEKGNKILMKGQVR